MKKVFTFLFAIVALAAFAGSNGFSAEKQRTEPLNPTHIIFNDQMGTPWHQHIFALNRDVQAAKAPVTQAPEGEVKTYKRTGSALFIDGQYITYGEQDGTIELTYAADGKVWFKNLLYGSTVFGDSYVYGILSEDGTTISVPMGQSIYYSSSYEADIVLAWGTSAISDNSIVFTVDADVTEAIFAIDGTTLTLQNSQDTPSGSSYPQYEGTGIGCYWTDDNSFGGLLDWYSAFTEFDAATMPENLAVTPAATTADVTWDGAEGENWNLRWRPWTDLSGNPFSCDMNLADANALNAYIESEMGDWIIIDNDADGYNWTIGGSEGDYYFQSYSWYNSSALTPDNWLITPPVKLEGVLKFSMWGSSYPDILMPYVCVGNPSSLDDFIALADEDYTTTSTKTEYTIDLSAYEGQMGRIAFRHYNCTDQYYVRIDDIFIGDPDAEIIQPAEWTYVNELDATEYTIDGLTPETKYEVQVQAYNEEDVTDWTDIVEFTTLAEQQPVEEGYFLVGTFNEWNQTADGGRIEFVDDAATVELEAGDEFKVITFDETGATVWYGGEDANQVGFFLINEDLLGVNITLVAGANFRVAEAGEYDMQLIWTRADVPMLLITKTPTAISTVGVDTKADNAYYNLLGVKFNSMPTVPGIYIHNGKKVIIK